MIKYTIDTEALHVPKYLYLDGYIGEIEYSEMFDMYCGILLSVPALFQFDGRNVKELQDDFRKAVANCKVYCENKGIQCEGSAFKVDIENTVFLS